MVMLPSKVELPINATADHSKCGSCRFFKRADNSYAEVYRTEGWCRIKLPPPDQEQKLIVRREPTEADCDTWGPRHVKDTDGCDLWKPMPGVIYIVSKEVGPHAAG